MFVACGLTPYSTGDKHTISTLLIKPIYIRCYALTLHGCENIFLKVLKTCCKRTSSVEMFFSKHRGKEDRTVPFTNSGISIKHCFQRKHFRYNAPMTANTQGTEMICNFCAQSRESAHVVSQGAPNSFLTFPLVPTISPVRWTAPRSHTGLRRCCFISCTAQEQYITRSQGSHSSLRY